jgi:selenide, water dikinase
MMEETIVTSELKLTQYSRGSGCGCKIAPSILEEILKMDNDIAAFKNLLVGNESNDDAAVYELPGTGNCLISTVDFFTPIVDDAYDFGRIAAANAISDVYAMGGSPVLAIAILGLPIDKIPAAVAKEILEGARAICKEAHMPLAGGHSIDSAEPIFGLAVNGLIKKNHLKKNNSAKPGDILFLTKPIGTGIIAAAQKRGKAKDDDVLTATELMAELNRVGEELGSLNYVNAMTDVTGFGLLGHLLEMMEGSNCSAMLDYKSVPVIKGIESYTSQFIFPDNTYRNWNSYEKKVSGVTGPSFITLCDPQTNGGLLVSVSPSAKSDFIQLMKERNILTALQPIGFVTEKRDFVVEVKE